MAVEADELPSLLSFSFSSRFLRLLLQLLLLPLLLLLLLPFIFEEDEEKGQEERPLTRGWERRAR